MSVASIEPMGLPVLLEFVAAAEFKENISERIGLPLLLDASEVTYLGSHCLQILLSAAAFWRKETLLFKAIDPSKEFSEGLEKMGISMSEITSEMDIK